MSKEYLANWNYPNSIVVGAGKASSVAEFCVNESIKAPLVVTDPGVSALPFFSRLCEALSASGLVVGVFDQVEGNPTGGNVESGVSVYRSGKHDGVIAVGGGSALDAGKAIALMVGQERPIWDFEDVGDNWLRVIPEGVAPVIAVPTTAGTGSEVGRASVITDTDAKTKKIIFHPKMLPVKVVLDPELTQGLPSHITAATGLDALSHCLEAYCANYYHPMADGIAIEGVRLIKENLLVAFNEGTNLEARTNMLVASSMGATAFQKGLGAMHAVAHSVGAVYGAHHGLLNAILMPYVLKTNEVQIRDRIDRLAAYIKLDKADFDGFVSWLLDFRSELNIPHSLSEILPLRVDVELLASMSVNDPSAGGNPVTLSEQDYAALIKRALEGVI